MMPYLASILLVATTVMMMGLTTGITVPGAEAAAAPDNSLDGKPYSCLQLSSTATSSELLQEKSVKNPSEQDSNTQPS